MPTYNSDIPEEFIDKAMPREAVVGQLDDAATIDGFLAEMNEAGLGDLRIHILSVADDEQATVSSALSNAGVRVLHRFGKWTYT